MFFVDDKSIRISLTSTHKIHKFLEKIYIYIYIYCNCISVIFIWIHYYFFIIYNQLHRIILKNSVVKVMLLELLIKHKWKGYNIYIKIVLQFKLPTLCQFRSKKFQRFYLFPSTFLARNCCLEIHREIGYIYIYIYFFFIKVSNYIYVHGYSFFLRRCMVIVNGHWFSRNAPFPFF